MPNPAGSTDPTSHAALPNPASYDTSTTGVVVDRVTGLTWQRDVPSHTYTWADARAHCPSVDLAGHRDWRLPTEIDLYSLVDFTVASGARIDASAFPSTPANWFWSSTPVAGGSSDAWGVNFDLGYSYNSGVGDTYNVRCVR